MICIYDFFILLKWNWNEYFTEMNILLKWTFHLFLDIELGSSLGNACLLYIYIKF